MEDTTTEITLDPDITGAETALETVENLLKDLSVTMDRFCRIMQKSLATLQAGFKKTVGCVEALTDSLQALMQQMSKEQSLDQLMEGVSTAVEGISLFASLAEPA